MKNKILIAILAIIVIVCGLYAIYLISETPSDAIYAPKRIDLTVASEGPFDVDKLCEEIRTHPYYEGYDNETVAWLEKYDDCQVLTSSDAFVVINKTEIGKIPILNANDVFINETFECNVVENRSLGDGLKDVLVVENIYYVDETVQSAVE